MVRKFFLLIKVFGLFLFFAILFFVFDFFTREYQVKKSSILIPLHTSPNRNLISIKTYIDKSHYSFVVNTASKLPCIINRQDLEEFQNGKEIGIQTWHQIDGKEYRAPKYLLEKAYLETVPITNTSYTINTAKQFGIGEQGSLGIPIFRQYDYWLFDFPKSRLYLVKDKKRFKKYFRLSFKRFIEHSLESVAPQITFKVHTELGERRFHLATGSEDNYMRKPPGNFTHNQKLTLQNLTINNQEMGPLDVTLIDFPDVFVPDDGALAMDFLQHRAVFLDFKDNKISIGPYETLPRSKTSPKKKKMKLHFN